MSDLVRLRAERRSLHAKLAHMTKERDALARWKRWTLLHEHLTPGSLDFSNMVERAEQRETMRMYGYLLRIMRTSAGYTMGDAADHIGCSVSDLSGVEVGRNPPFDEATSRTLCVFLRAHPDALLNALTKCEELLRGG